jgi:antitoxin (DNA-binding transcriptional repressor) of toxin-antitoxin stability system
VIDPLPVIDVQDATERLEELVDMAAKGKPFYIAENGKPLVKVSEFKTDDV